MRIDELIGIKHLQDKQPSEAVEWLHQEFKAGRTKLKILGHGSNGIALTNGVDVFKFWMFDSAYEDFVNFSLANQDNPCLPKFKSKIKTIPHVFTSLKLWNKKGKSINAQDVRYVKMELLEPYTGRSSFMLFTDPKIRKVIEEEDNGANYVSVTALMELGESFSGKLKNDISVLIEDHMIDAMGYDAPYLEYIKHLNPELLQFITTLGKINSVVDNSHSFDPGTRNLALRGKQVVILDPIMNAADIDLNTRFLGISDIRITS